MKDESEMCESDAMRVCTLCPWCGGEGYHSMREDFFPSKRMKRKKELVVVSTNTQINIPL